MLTTLGGRRRRWLVAAAGLGTLLLAVALAAFFVMPRLTGGLEQEEIQRSIGRALEGGQRSGDRVVFELTGEELAELIQEGVAASGVALDELTIDVAAADRPDRGRLRVRGEADGGDRTFSGVALVEAIDGELDVEMRDFDLRGYGLPNVANSAAGNLVAEAVTLEPLLAERGLRLRDVAFADDEMRIVAFEPDSGPVARRSAGRTEGADDADGDADDADPGTAADDLPPPGEASRKRVDGDPAMIVLGDSVAAGVGVDDLAKSYVSRVHAWLQRRDGTEYGLANFAISGETSWSLRQDGQLDRALAELNRREAALIVVDIGANDVLSALHHPACADDISSDQCRALVDGRLDDYRTNFAATLTDLRDAAPRAPLAVMTTYNPFSFGGSTDFEQRSDEVVADLNRIAVRVGRQHGARIADAATPLADRASELTHMGSSGPPDVHPNAAGYAELAGALVEALERPAARPGGQALEPQPR